MAVTFTERELDIMAVLWERGPSTVAEVRGTLADELSHNTVATMLTILENKGYVDHVEDGRAFRYRPRVGREEAGQSAFQRLIDSVFAGSADNARPWPSKTNDFRHSVAAATRVCRVVAPALCASPKTRTMPGVVADVCPISLTPPLRTKP